MKPEHIHYVMASNANTSSLDLEELSKIDNTNLKCDIAQNPSASKELLEKLSQDGSYLVRGFAISSLANKGASVDQLKKYLNDPCPVIKKLVFDLIDNFKQWVK